MKGNIVAKHFWKSSRAKIEPNKHKQLKDLAQLKVELEDALEAEIDGISLCSGELLNINEEEE